MKKLKHLLSTISMIVMISVSMVTISKTIVIGNIEAEEPDKTDGQCVSLYNPSPSGRVWYCLPTHCKWNHPQCMEVSGESNETKLDCHKYTPPPEE